MHLTDHVTDEQLNEYLDHETDERAQIEAHLSTCDECTARLAALEALFVEIESLPDLTLSHSIAAKFTRPSDLPAQLPRWITLTGSLQAALALIILITSAPLVVDSLPAVEIPTVADLSTQLQSQWTAWLRLLFSFQFPTIPQIPVPEMPSVLLTLTLVSLFILWLLGNGLLLRRETK